MGSKAFGAWLVSLGDDFGQVKKNCLKVAKDCSVTQTQDLAGALGFHQAEEKCQTKATLRLTLNCWVSSQAGQIELLKVPCCLGAQDVLPTRPAALMRG